MMIQARRIALAAFVLLGPVACVGDGSSGPVAGELATAAAPRLVAPSDPTRSRDSYVAKSRKAMVAAAHPLASEAGLKILQEGGNAMDAAVAASFAISVVRPQSTGLGGGGFLVAYEAAKKHTDVFDFRERAPLKATRDMYLDAKGEPTSFRYEGVEVPNSSVNGHLAVGVPGLVKGLLEVHAKYGKLPLGKVMAPAILIAESGFPVYKGLAEALEERQDVLKVFPGTKKIFFRQGKPLKLGDVLIQRDLAWTLKRIAAKGAAGFYKGEVAKRLVAEMQRGKGLVTQKDLDQYTVKHQEPVVGTYRGYQIVSMPPPSSGGVHVIEILNMLAGDDYGGLRYGSTASVHLLAESMRRAFADRAEYLGDPEFVKVPLKGLVSPAYAKDLRKSIDTSKATPSTTVKAGQPMAYESASTSHISVVDGAGNAVSTTQTVNWSFGSGVVADGTGIVLNDEMDDFAKKPGVPNAFGLVGNDANAIAARKTMLSSMSPTLVFGEGGKLRLVVGSPGGPRIISATLQTIINVIDHKMTLPDAVHASRIHHQWLPDELKIEKDGLAAGVRDDLEKMGHKVVEGGAIGDVQAIEVTPEGLVGVSDTRSEGMPRGL